MSPLLVSHMSAHGEVNLLKIKKYFPYWLCGTSVVLAAVSGWKQFFHGNSLSARKVNTQTMLVLYVSEGL